MIFTEEIRLELINQGFYVSKVALIDAPRDRSDLIDHFTKWTIDTRQAHQFPKIDCFFGIKGAQSI